MARPRSNNKITKEVHLGQLWMYAKNHRLYEVMDIRGCIVHMHEYKGMHKRYATVQDILYSEDWLDVIA